MHVPSPLLEALDAIGAGVEACPHLLLLLDFDGTLAPIVEVPQLARMPDATRAVLEPLVRRRDCTVGVVSGRSLEDVQARVGIPGVVYAGNHGLEISGRGIEFTQARAIDLMDVVAEVAEALAGRLAGIPGVLLEFKGLTASVHDRLVSPADRDSVERLVRAAVPPDHPHLVAGRGKLVWELRPRVRWNKGTAVRFIRERLGLCRTLTIYLGDDRTDEDAFAEVGRFVTARVGTPQSTRAGYHVTDTLDVGEFLQWLSRVVRFADAPGRC
jgi:trehalose 6-phosphate phosphatase